jgi:hypothetical protein
MTGKVIHLKDTAPVAPSPSETDGDGAKGQGGGPPPGLPADCPVTPLGMSADGANCFYLDASQRLHVKSGKEHSRLGVLMLFNHRWQVLQEYWPRLTKVKDEKTGEVDYIATGWKPERAAEELIAACGRRGTLNIADRVRGPGAWRAPDGTLILHCGDRVLVGSEWMKPGEIAVPGAAAGTIYPADARTPLPADSFAPGGAHGPAAEALELFRGWQWKQPEIGPYLLLGALGAAKLGGALRWRPTVWLTGELGSGKSTLFEYFAALCGEGGVHLTIDTTPAGVWQRTGHSSHPVMIDEAEAENDPKRMGGMIKLARAASSGGVVYRGGSEHRGVEFQIKGCFVFGSILLPGLTPQDRSRITVLELSPLTGIKPPVISALKLKAMGEALTRRLVDGWGRLTETFERYREALAESGHRARGADQYGILLACADLMLHDHNEISSDEMARWCELLPPEPDAARDHQNCVAHLLTAPIDPYRGGGRRTISQWLIDAISAEPDQPATANRALETYGLSVEIEPAPGWVLGQPPLTPLRWLYVANTHRGLAQLFEGSHWAGQSGTSSPWVQALRRVPYAVATDRKRFAGYQARATKLPLDDLLKGCEGSE